MELRDVVKVFRTFPEAEAHLKDCILCVPYLVEAPRDDLELIHECILDVWITQHAKIPLRAFGTKGEEERHVLLFGMDHALIARHGLLRRVHSMDGTPILQRITKPTRLHEDRIARAGLNHIHWTPMMGPSLKGSYLWEAARLLQPNWADMEEVALSTPTIRALHNRGVRFNPTKPQKVF